MAVGELFELKFVEGDFLIGATSGVAEFDSAEFVVVFVFGAVEALITDDGERFAADAGSLKGNFDVSKVMIELGLFVFGEDFGYGLEFIFHWDDFRG